mgnify:CR=1 FL=1
MNKTKTLNKFMNDVKKVIEKYLENHKNINIEDLIRSNDLFLDTLRKEVKKWKKESSKKLQN